MYLNYTNNWDWIINGTSTSNPTGSNPSVIMSNAGAHTAYLIAYNSCGFYHVDSLVVNVDGTPTLNVSASQTTICPGGSSNLNVSGANSYLWTPANSLNSNNVSNPVAKTDPQSPIFGMPVLDVEKCKSVLFVKRSLSPGYAGVDNELFYRENTMMLFADAKKMTEDIVKNI